MLLAPRLAEGYASYGVIATIEQVGRMRGGAPAAVLKAERRAKIGHGVTGPGAALWVEAEPVETPPADGRTKELRPGSWSTRSTSSPTPPPSPTPRVTRRT
ncbi:Lon class III heat-shock ATP-dependent protease [Mycobacteroides abscessus subsp. abscessus]|nr:Lon class III heat-shock ATP-dependent protease [Mycobacteroides abscessus subsp. abscessus]